MAKRTALRIEISKRFARRIRKIDNILRNYRFYEPPRIRPDRRVRVTNLALRTPKRAAVVAEVIRIGQKKVLPRNSLLSFENCRTKRKRNRRDYFAYLATGRGKSRRQHRNRFTVRC